jgi:hypothetical protein
MVSQRMVRATLLMRGHKKVSKYKKGQNAKKVKYKPLVFANIQCCWQHYIANMQYCWQHYIANPRCNLLIYSSQLKVSYLNIKRTDGMFKFSIFIEWYSSKKFEYPCFESNARTLPRLCHCLFLLKRF